MEKMSTQRRLGIVRGYLSGLSYDEISKKTGVSKGSVSNIVEDMKAGKIPEAVSIIDYIDELRELSVELKRLKATPIQCITGLTLLNRINECGLEPTDIEWWPVILKGISNEDDASEFVDCVYRLAGIQKRTGLTVEALETKATQLEEKVKELAPAEQQVTKIKKEITTLIRQRTGLRAETQQLEKERKQLTADVADLEKRKTTLSQNLQELEPRVRQAEQVLIQLNEENKKLKTLGVSMEDIAVFSELLITAALKLTIKPRQLGERFQQELTNLQKGMSLEALIKTRQGELDKVEQTITREKNEVQVVQAALADLKREKTALEFNIKAIKEKVGQEIQQLVPIARETIQRFNSEMDQGGREILAQVQDLKNQALAAGKEIGRCEGIVDSNQWLKDILTLIQGDTALEAGRVRIILLMILHGSITWSASKMSTYEDPRASIERLIPRVEEWKT